MLDELFRAIVEHLTKKTMFYGFYRYRVVYRGLESASTSKVIQPSSLVTLQTASKIEGLPDFLSLPVDHGLAGAVELLAPSTLVLVGFEGGNPGAPFVAHVLPGQVLPVTIQLNATAAIIAGDSTSQPVALAAASDSNFGILLAAVNVLNGLATPPKPALPDLPSVAASKLFAE